MDKHRNLILECQNLHEILMSFHGTVVPALDEVKKWIHGSWCLGIVARMLRLGSGEILSQRTVRWNIRRNHLNANLWFPDASSQMKTHTHPQNYTHTYTFIVKYTYIDILSQVCIQEHIQSQYIHTHKQMYLHKWLNTHTYTHTKMAKLYILWYTEQLNRIERVKHFTILEI